MKSGCLLKSVISKIYVSNTVFSLIPQGQVLQWCCLKISTQQIILQMKHGVHDCPTYQFC